MLSQKIKLTLDDIFSKFGFEDGDLIDYYLESKNYNSRMFPVKNHHKVLYQLFMFHAKPYLNRKKKIMFCDTCHNPVRIKEDEMEDGNEWFLKDLADLEDIILIDEKYLYELLNGRFFKNICRCCWIYFNLYVLSFFKNIIWFFNQRK